MGPNAVMNFPNVLAKTKMVINGGTKKLGKCGIPNEAESSLKSVLHYDKLTALDGLSYCNVNAFKFVINMLLCLPDEVLLSLLDEVSSTKYFIEEEFGEFDPNMH
ncbi:hypothetical protein L1049_010646 [Liquidambar formosana]|uniref:Uncharacterized protein n=1 Tax=Liquidambar formosana TaxID=63359 RepID=A0AAP0N7X0_LIQFO